MTEYLPGIPYKKTPPKEKATVANPVYSGRPPPPDFSLPMYADYTEELKLAVEIKYEIDTNPLLSFLKCKIAMYNNRKKDELRLKIRRNRLLFRQPVYFVLEEGNIPQLQAMREKLKMAEDGSIPPSLDFAIRAAQVGRSFLEILLNSVQAQSIRDAQGNPKPTKRHALIATIISLSGAAFVGLVGILL
jgi:hypothetical protein